MHINMFPGGSPYLTGQEAWEVFFYLICGEYLSRNYRHVKRYQCGYFYVDVINKWVLFDNRNRTFYVDVFDSYRSLEEAIRDGEELFAA